MATLMSRQDARQSPRTSWDSLPPVTTNAEVHVGPFATLRDVMAFIERLKGVSGVRDVRIDRWVSGWAVLQVRHHDRVPLIAALRALEESTLSISIRQPHGIRIEMRPPA